MYGSMSQRGREYKNLHLRGIIPILQTGINISETLFCPPRSYQVTSLANNMRSKAILKPLTYTAALAGIVMVEAGDSITQPSTTGMTNKAIESSTIYNSYCHFTSHGQFTVYTETWGYKDQSHCDEGMKDDIRHQCRTWPQGWKCAPNGTEKYPHGASATWTMTNWVQDGCVEKAISMAAGRRVLVSGCPGLGAIS